jgi:hypothetical protein
MMSTSILPSERSRWNGLDDSQFSVGVFILNKGLRFLRIRAPSLRENDNLAISYCILRSLVSGERTVLTLVVTHVDDFFGSLGSGHWFQGNKMTKEMRDSVVGTG